MHFASFLTSFAIKSNVYLSTHKYLIINYSQSKRAQFYGYISLADKTIWSYSLWYSKSCLSTWCIANVFSADVPARVCDLLIDKLLRFKIIIFCKINRFNCQVINDLCKQHMKYILLMKPLWLNIVFRGYYAQVNVTSFQNIFWHSSMNFNISLSRECRVTM